MGKPLRYYTGFEGRDLAALDVCIASMNRHASIDIDVRVLKDWELRAAGVFDRPYRVDEAGRCEDGRDGLPFGTAFSFTRFAVPLIAPMHEPVLWSDPDFMWRADVAELMRLAADQPDKAVLCVHHDHRPPEATKFGGTTPQLHYFRKNWSSLMVIRPWLCLACGFDREKLNRWSGAALHGLLWLPNEMIGELPVEWNWLEGWSDSSIAPKAVHFTRGTPDMKGHEDATYAAEWRGYFHQEGSELTRIVGRSAIEGRPF